MLIAEIVGVTPISTIHQVVIDKGAADGVRIGHAVLDSEGLFGQVLEVSQFSARVLMITDARHGLPVEGGPQRAARHRQWHRAKSTGCKSTVCR